MRTIPSAPLRLVAALLVTLACAIAHARLPEDALRKAQQAEKLVQQNRVKDAIVILQELERAHPAEAAVSLRIAQLFDGMGQEGAALFYYRRYAAQAGDRARDEATARLQTLEIMANARAGAEEFAKAMKDKTKPASTPATSVEMSVLKAGPDGTLTNLKPSDVGLPDELAAGTKPPPPPPSPTPVPMRTITSGPAAPIAVFGDAQARTRPAFTPPPISDPARAAEAAPAASPTPGAAPKPTVAPTPAGPRPPVRIEVLSTPEPTRAADTAGPSLSALEAAMMPSPPDGVVAPPPTGAPPRRTAKPGIFSTRSIAGRHSALKVTNATAESMLAVNVVPRAGGESVNILLANGETRTAEFAPGDCDVIVTMTRQTYPPSTIFDRRFDFRFEPGVQYEKTFDGTTLEATGF